jgi:hypothetical protein
MTPAEGHATHKHCFTCGEQIFGGPGGWHTANGRERCFEAQETWGYHEPMVVRPGDFDCCEGTA